MSVFFPNKLQNTKIYKHIAKSKCLVVENVTLQTFLLELGIFQCVVICNFNIHSIIFLCSGIIRRVMLKKMGLAVLSNESFPELDDHHHLGHVDAAFHMHSEDSPENHDQQFFFLDIKVFSYYKHKLEKDYPKDISEIFPGIPDHLDAAVECPKPDCTNDTIIFFKGDEIYHFDEFKSMPSCTGAFRYMDHYYCFHGHQFSKFDPVTGEVCGRYLKETRDYFMRCPYFGKCNNEHHIEREQCSRVHLDAITSDDDGSVYAFRGHHFLSTTGDKFHSDTIKCAFKELHSEVDAVFSYEGHLYMIKIDNEVFVYKVGEPHTHLEGYPKLLKDVLGIEGPVDAAFACAEHHIAHVIKGINIVYDVDLKATPRVPVKEGTITHLRKVDTAICGPKGVTVISNYYYQYASPMIVMMAKMLPEQHRVSQELFGCDH
uniref:Hemopexin a n=1 Tax=Cyprinus carpio TaxID=7962 RepID=A0A8C2GZ58_CYPCA